MEGEVGDAPTCTARKTPTSSPPADAFYIPGNVRAAQRAT